MHFGMLHEEDCRELSTTNDWVPFDDVSEESLEELNLKQCSQCLQ